MHTPLFHVGLNFLLCSSDLASPSDSSPLTTTPDMVVHLGPASQGNHMGGGNGDPLAPLWKIHRTDNLGKSPKSNFLKVFIYILYLGHQQPLKRFRDSVLISMFCNTNNHTHIASYGGSALPKNVN
jgi:hypothetical protein